MSKVCGKCGKWACVCKPEAKKVEAPKGGQYRIVSKRGLIDRQIYDPSGKEIGGSVIRAEIDIEGGKPTKARLTLAPDAVQTEILIDEKDVEICKDSDLRRRKGFVTVSSDVERNFPEILMGICKVFAPVDIVHECMNPCSVYKGFSPLFDIVNEGCKIPHYLFEFTRQVDGKVSVKAVKEVKL